MAKVLQEFVTAAHEDLRHAYRVWKVSTDKLGQSNAQLEQAIGQLDQASAKFAELEKLQPRPSVEGGTVRRRAQPDPRGWKTLAVEKGLTLRIGRFGSRISSISIIGTSQMNSPRSPISSVALPDWQLSGFDPVLAATRGILSRQARSC